MGLTGHSVVSLTLDLTEILIGDWAMGLTGNSHGCPMIENYAHGTYERLYGTSCAKRPHTSIWLKILRAISMFSALLYEVIDRKGYHNNGCEGQDCAQGSTNFKDLCEDYECEESR